LDYRLGLAAPHTIGRLTAVFDKEARTVVFPAKAGLIFPCIAIVSAVVLALLTSPPNTLVASMPKLPLSGEQRPGNLNGDKQRAEPQHFCKRDGRCKLQGSWDGLLDYAITPHPQSATRVIAKSGTGWH